MIAKIEAALANLSPEDVRSMPLADATREGLVTVEDVNGLPSAACPPRGHRVPKSRPGMSVVYDAMFGAERAV
ncbi:MAG: hypothetical protein WKH64_13775 [Chloroflexia bacterium]